MKKRQILFIAIMLLGMIATSPLFTGCGETNQLPEPVCQYGGYIADLGEYVCSNVPEIPPAICALVHLAKINLDILCSESPDSQAYQDAASSLATINVKLSAEIKRLESKQVFKSK